MKQYLFLGDSITDADHLFDPANLGYGYVSLLARRPEYVDARFVNRGHEGFTIERVLQMLRRDGIGGHWDAITLLAGVNDIPVELFTSHSRIPLEFSAFYREVLDLLCQHTSTILLLEPFLFDEPAEYSAWHPYIEKESQIIHDLALSYSAHFITTDSILRQAARQEGIDAITTDGIHLTPHGNTLLADLWHQAFTALSMTDPAFFFFLLSSPVHDPTDSSCLFCRQSLPPFFKHLIEKS